MNVFNRIAESYEKEKIPALDQKGPKSLNYINRKKEFVRVFKGNEILKNVIDNARSDYAHEKIALH
jgi:hypothetical protein